jgi:AAA domain
MATMNDVNFDALYVMMKGEPGTRKSTQALSFPGPQFWFSWDRKMSGIYLPMKKWGIDPKTITYEDYDDWTKPKKKLESFQIDCPYRTIIVDSVTSMADMTLRQTVQLKYGKTRSSGAQAGKLIAGIAVNEIEDYNAESSALNELIALTKDINNHHKVNIILIAHVVKAEYRDTTKNITHISRQIVTAGKNVAAKIPAYCGEVYHFNIKKGFVEGQGGDYSLLTEHTGDDFARTALGLDREIVFGEKPLYDTYIKPAITKMKEDYTPTSKF